MDVMILSGVHLILWSFSTVIVLVSYFEAVKGLATGLLNTITMPSMCFILGSRTEMPSESGWLLPRRL